MQTRRSPSRVAALGLVALAVVLAGPASAQTPAPASTQIDEQSMSLGNGVQGVLYRPAATDQRSGTAVLVMHTFASYINFFACRGLANRGFQVWCADGPYLNLANDEVFDRLALAVKSSMDFLRQQPGIQRVVVLGHSAGAPEMAYYQLVAENGPAACQTGKLFPCADNLAGLAPADGVILLDPTPGDPFTSLMQLDPAVGAEDQFGHVSDIDPSLDMFAPDNGFRGNAQAGEYSPSFVQRFYAAQAARHNRLQALANERAAAIDAGSGVFTDTEPFIVARNAAQLHSYDLQLLSHTKQPHTLLTAQGPRQTIVDSIRPPGISVTGVLPLVDQQYGPGSLGGAFKGDVRSYLATQQITVDPAQFLLTEDDIQGVQWSSTNDSTPGDLADIHAPLLLVSATGHYWVVPTEIAYDLAASPDKTLAYVYGATHGFSPCTACQTDPSLLGDTQTILVDYLAQWLTSHIGR